MACSNVWPIRGVNLGEAAALMVSGAVSPPHRRRSVHRHGRCESAAQESLLQDAILRGRVLIGSVYLRRVDRLGCGRHRQVPHPRPKAVLASSPSGGVRSIPRDARPGGLAGGWDPTVSQPRGGWQDSPCNNLRGEVVRGRFRLTPVASNPGQWMLLRDAVVRPQVPIPGDAGSGRLNFQRTGPGVASAGRHFDRGIVTGTSAHSSPILTHCLVLWVIVGRYWLTSVDVA